MVCCSLRHRGDELLGQRRGLAAYAATGSTMGIPFLHPWANRLDGRRLVVVEGALAERRVLGLLLRANEVGEDPVAFTARHDRRVVTVRFERGYPYAQVFAPPGQSFVCFEPMTATVSALTHPGACPLVAAYDATFAIEVGSTMGA
jgi:galactose mutarotase-like enzyme